MSTPAVSEFNTNADQAYAYIKERLLRDEFSPGMRLAEEQLAREIGASRTPVREALRRLVAEGLLVSRPNAGTFVGTFTEEEMRQLFDLRVLLESEVAAAAADHMTAAQLGELYVLQGEIESRGLDLDAGNLWRIADLNRRFHGVIAAGSGNPRLIAMLSNAIEQPIVQRTFRRYTQAQLQRSFYQHRELIDALRVRDRAWAGEVMRCHVRAAKHAMLESGL